MAKFRETRGDDVGGGRPGAGRLRRRAGFLTRFDGVMRPRLPRAPARDPGVIMVRLAMYAMLSALIGAMYANVGDDKDQESVVARVSSYLWRFHGFYVGRGAALRHAPARRVRERADERPLRRSCLNTYCHALRGAEYREALLAVATTLLVVFPPKLNGPVIYGLDLFVSFTVAEGFMSLVAACVRTALHHRHRPGGGHLRVSHAV